jgi:hypothetical protein
MLSRIVANALESFYCEFDHRCNPNPKFTKSRQEPSIFCKRIRVLIIRHLLFNMLNTPDFVLNSYKRHKAKTQKVVTRLFKIASDCTAGASPNLY